jgi:putative ABC transport system ATP-binding protein
MITINNLKKSFSGLLPVLNDINLSFKQRDFCVIIGANGCGKSTLLKAISGEYKVDSGTIKIAGTVAQVVQDINLGIVPEMTLLENIALSQMKTPKFALYSRYKEQVLVTIQGLNMGLEAYINQPLQTLSGGQRQVIATVMAINSGCDILLLDEHTSALDPKMQKILMDYTARQIAELGLTAIMITHKMEDVIKYGNRLVILNQGKVKLDIQENEKQMLKIEDLLALFHQHGDKESPIESIYDI